jgi:hypothetical protein
LARAEFGVNFDDGMDFFAGVAVGFEADLGFEQVKGSGEIGFFGRGRLLRSGCERNEQYETRRKQGAQVAHIQMRSFPSTFRDVKGHGGQFRQAIRQA